VDWRSENAESLDFELCLFTSVTRSRGSSVSTENSLRAGPPGLDSRQGEGIFFPPRHHVQTDSGVLPAFHIQSVRGPSPALKWPERETNAEVKMRGSIPPLPQYVFMVWNLIKQWIRF
jgi:hypothetical protein